jgi:transcriptional regulator with XRE-family HTH domain
VSRKRTATARSSSTPGGGRDIELLRRVGLTVRIARVGRGMAQRELAQKIGKSQNLIWTVESGKKDVGIVLLTRIANALQMPLEFFLIPIRTSAQDSSPERRRSFDEGRAMLLSLMEAMDLPADKREGASAKSPRKPAGS